ncbi:tetratricopeptide repeat protein [Aureliella helgolandensis]|uniref:Tetratricopeptide repeat protein n=1 Tax=Aureliella helgolandensis TaxID=2527968 RepID=A0A518GFW0_9BACT|nr:hypothetical protein [Aureliella helgolandensis]QDV27482.1 hypothetical protein Q31a_58710 [Aureliella helgolandensis]
MVSFKPVALILALTGSMLAGHSASAGDGYPPFGAWAYGSGSSPSFYSTGYSAAYRPVHRLLHHHAYARAGCATPYFRTPVRNLLAHCGAHCCTSRFSYSRAMYSLGPSSLRPLCCLPRVEYCGPVCVAPCFGSAPAPYGVGGTYESDWGSGYDAYAPEYEESWELPLGSLKSAPDSVEDDSLVSEVVLTSGRLAVNDGRSGASSARVRAASLADSSELSYRYVAVEKDSPVPAEVLAAADAIFRAGGYREAARAYAEISARYGAEPVLFGRRFVAQVASGDAFQAAVVAGSAALSGVVIRQEDLPADGLLGLGLTDQQIESWTELLSSRALADPDDALSMEAVGRWLDLAGDKPRAELFLARAARLRGDEVIPSESGGVLELSESVSKPERSTTKAL